MKTCARAVVLLVYVFWTSFCDGTPTYPTFTAKDVKCMFDGKSDPLNCPTFPGVGDDDDLQCKTCWVGEAERCVHSDCSVVNPPPSNWNDDAMCQIMSSPLEGCPSVNGPSGEIKCSACEIDGVEKCIHEDSDCSAFQSPDPCNFYAVLDKNEKKRETLCDKDWSCEWDAEADVKFKKCKPTEKPHVPVDVKALKADVKTLKVALTALQADVAALQEENTNLQQQLQQVYLGQRVTDLETDDSDVEPLGVKVTNLEENVGALQPQVVDITADVEALQDANSVPDIMVKGPFVASNKKYYTSTGDGIGYGQFETPVLYNVLGNTKSATSFCALDTWTNSALKSRHGTNPQCQLTAGVQRDYDFTPRYKRWAIYKGQFHADGHIYCGATCLDGKDISFVNTFNLNYRNTYAWNAAPEAGKMFCGLSNVELKDFFNTKHNNAFDCQVTQYSDSWWTLRTTGNVNRSQGPYNNCEATCMQSTKFQEIVISNQVTAEWPSTSNQSWQREEILDYTPNKSYCALIRINQQVFLEDTTYSPACQVDVYNGKYRLKATTARLPNNLKSRTTCRAACVTW